MQSILWPLCWKVPLRHKQWCPSPAGRTRSGVAGDLDACKEMGRPVCKKTGNAACGRQRSVEFPFRVDRRLKAVIQLGADRLQKLHCFPIRDMGDRNHEELYKCVHSVGGRSHRVDIPVPIPKVCQQGWQGNY